MTKTWIRTWCLFASKEQDIFGVSLGFTHAPDANNPTESVVEFGLQDTLEDEEDPLTVTRLKWRAEIAAEHDAGKEKGR